MGFSVFVGQPLQEKEIQATNITLKMIFCHISQILEGLDNYFDPRTETSPTVVVSWEV